MQTTTPERMAMLRVAYDTITGLADHGVDIVRAVSVLATAPATAGRLVPDETIFAATIFSIATGIERVAGRTEPHPTAAFPAMSDAPQHLVTEAVLEAAARLDEIGADPQEAAILFAMAATHLVLQQDGDPVAVASYLRAILAEADADRLAATAPAVLH